MAEHPEAIIVFSTALVCGATFIALTAYSGYSRLLGFAHLPWIPLVIYLITRLGDTPFEPFFGFWLRAVIVLDIGSMILDTSNVIRYFSGDRQEMVAGLSKEVSPSTEATPRSS